MSRIRIATRESQLALWQANEVARLLKNFHPDIDIEIIGMTTQGGRHLPQQEAKGYSLKNWNSVY